MEMTAELVGSCDRQAKWWTVSRRLFYGTWAEAGPSKEALNALHAGRIVPLHTSD